MKRLLLLQANAKVSLLIIDELRICTSLTDWRRAIVRDFLATYERGAPSSHQPAVPGMDIGPLSEASHRRAARPLTHYVHLEMNAESYGLKQSRARRKIKTD